MDFAFNKRANDRILPNIKTPYQRSAIDSGHATATKDRIITFPENSTLGDATQQGDTTVELGCQAGREDVKMLGQRTDSRTHGRSPIRIGLG